MVARNSQSYICMSSAYQQVQLDESSREYVTIKTPFWIEQVHVYATTTD